MHCKGRVYRPALLFESRLSELTHKTCSCRPTVLAACSHFAANLADSGDDLVLVGCGKFGIAWKRQNLARSGFGLRKLAQAVTQLFEARLQM